LLFGALAEAAPFLKDDQRIVIWEQKFLAQLGDANRADKREAMRGSTLAMSAGATP
jgi:hypothetical protein